MKDNSSTKVENSTDATIAAIPCYVPCGLELNRIYNESNFDTMKRMPDNFVDLTVTSPPYDGLRDYNGYSLPFEEIAKELYRVTKEGGVYLHNSPSEAQKFNVVQLLISRTSAPTFGNTLLAAAAVNFKI